MKLYTGAQRNAMSKNLALEIGAKITNSTVRRLIAYGDQKLDVIGQTIVTCGIDEKSYMLTFIVVNANVNPILGQLVLPSD